MHPEWPDHMYILTTNFNA